MNVNNGGWSPVDQDAGDLTGFGITTGTCAAAAVCASALMLKGRSMPDHVLVTTPESIRLNVSVSDSKPPNQAERSQTGWARVIKDAGDDPDVTDGIAIYALVRPLKEPAPFPDYPSTELVSEGSLAGSLVVGGPGVGKVTLGGLKSKIGAPAINPGPLTMIINALKEAGLHEPVRVTVCIPEGIELAKRTFNPRLGVVDGISVLGTTGFVRPMSSKALIDTVEAELDVRLHHRDAIMLAFGATGEKAAKRLFDIDVEHSVQMSNFVGVGFDGAIMRGARHILITGHPGKLIKISAGIMDTHSSAADARAEIMTAHAALAGASQEAIHAIWNSNTTQEALDIVDQYGLNGIWQTICDRCKEVLDARALRRCDRTSNVACVMIARDDELLAASGDLDTIVSNLGGTVSGDLFQGVSR